MASTSETAPVKKVQLEGKIIAITGANRGSYHHLIIIFQLPTSPQVSAIDIGTPGEEFAALSKQYPHQLFALQADVTKEDSIQAAVDEILKSAGALHGMVCNAGRTKHKPALDFTTEEIDQLWGVNLYGSFYTARVAARAFIKQGVKGSIVFTASMASYRPNKVRTQVSNINACLGHAPNPILIYALFADTPPSAYPPPLTVLAKPASAT
jgi:NAD(P)-dependent dehydrogenase (short-subunit alcohol dehydrogenase family)